MLDLVLLKEVPEASQHILYEEIFTYIERIKKALESLYHMEYEDIFSSWSTTELSKTFLQA